MMRFAAPLETFLPEGITLCRLKYTQRSQPPLHPLPSIKYLSTITFLAIAHHHHSQLISAGQVHIWTYWKVVAELLSWRTCCTFCATLSPPTNQPTTLSASHFLLSYPHPPPLLLSLYYIPFKASVLLSLPHLYLLPTPTGYQLSLEFRKLSSSLSRRALRGRLQCHHCTRALSRQTEFRV